MGIRPKLVQHVPTEAMTFAEIAAALDCGKQDTTPKLEWLAAWISAAQVPIVVKALRMAAAWERDDVCETCHGTGLNRETLDYIEKNAD